MFKTVVIREFLPRDLSLLDSSFMDGLQAYRFFGYFFLIGALFLLFLSAVKFRMLFPSVFFIILAGMGGYMLYYANQTKTMREETFLNGEIVIGRVEEHGRQFNPFKSTRDYTLTIALENDSSDKRLKVTYKNKQLWTNAPLGSKLIGLKLGTFYLWGEEIGCKFMKEL